MLKTLKKLKFYIIATGIGLIALCSARDDYDYYGYKPVLMERDKMESAVEASASRELINPGKIYCYQNFMLVVEKKIGVHIFDISNAESPQNKGFLIIPGCSEVAVSNGYLYANSAVDLISIKIDSYPEISVTDRKRDLFPELLSPDGYIPEKYAERNRPENTVIIDWIPASSNYLRE